MRLFRSAFELHYINEWTESTVVQLTKMLLKLRVSNGAEVAHYSGVPRSVPNQDVALGAAADSLSEWCREALEFAQGVLRDSNLEFTRCGIVAVAEPKFIELSASAFCDYQGHEQSNSFGMTAIERTGRSQFRYYSTPRTKWLEWLREERRFKNTPIDVLLASDEVEIVDDGSGSFSTPGMAGRTLYEKR